MEEAVTFSNYIQPICLSQSNINVFNSTGVVSGYGQQDANDWAVAEPKHIKMDSVDLAKCYSSSVESSKIVSIKSFCASSQNGTPCFGKMKNVSKFFYIL